MLKLLMLRWTLFKSPLHHSVLKKRTLLTVAGLLIVPAIIYNRLIYLFSNWYYSPEINFGPEMISGTLFGLGVFLMFSGLSVVFQKQYLDKDMALLRVLPLTSNSIYRYKFMDTCFSNMAFFIMFGGPVVLAAARVLQMPAWYYPVLLVASALYVVIPTGFSTLIALLIVRIAPVNSSRRLTSILVGVVIIGGWLALQWVRTATLDPLSAEFDNQTLNTLHHISSVVSGGMIPSTWISEIIFFPETLNLYDFVKYSLLLSASAVLFIYMSGALLSRFEFAQHRLNKRGKRHKAEYRPKSFVRVLLSKEIRIDFRDTRFIQSDILAMAFVVFLPIFLQRSSDHFVETLPNLSTYIVMSLVISMLTVALARNSIPKEQYAFLYLVIAPVKIKVFLWVKQIKVSLLILSAGAVGLSVMGIHDRIPFTDLLFVFIIQILICMGAGAIGLWGGARAAKFDWSDPRYMLQSGFSVLTTVLTMIFAVLGWTMLGIGWTTGHQTVAFLLFFLYVSLIYKAFFDTSVKYLTRLEWDYQV
ncbi:MAG: hypothetical protein U5R06_20550 [candidate division KSB1 bacterium]|nr:hypothetical protein [candidate division KSB1 bacterium]